MKRTKFTPKQGETYKNQGGGTFRCLRSGGFLGDYEATMQNVASGWTFAAKGCGVYEDGTIDWDYSTSGRFKFYSSYLACLIGTLIAFELCWIGAKYIFEGEVVHTYLDHFIAVCGSWYLTRDTMKLWLKLHAKSQKAQH